MLNGSQTIGSYSANNIALWMLMAFQAGVLNVGGLLSCGRFVSHVTGFAGYFGYEVGRANYPAALGMLIVPTFFFLGAMISGELVEVRMKAGRRPSYHVAFGVLFSLILAVFLGGTDGYFGEFGSFAAKRSYLLIACLTFACGIQNGTVTSVSKSVIRTTHLSGITTDLGLGIVRLLHPSLFRNENRNELNAFMMRTGIIFFFSGGSVIGAIIFLRFQFWGFGIPLFTSGLLFSLMMYNQLIRKQPNTSD